MNKYQWIIISFTLLVLLSFIYSAFLLNDDHQPASNPIIQQKQTQQSDEQPTTLTIQSNDNHPRPKQNETSMKAPPAPIQQKLSSNNEIVTPPSYPVEDAVNYHLPAEQRRPGQLGGPPPLTLPNSPQ